MGKDTAIAWCHHTFNPWWGCVEVSPECDECYARMFAKRTGHDVWGVEAPRRHFGDKHWQEPLKWNAAAQAAGERRRVFCASMADIFEYRADLDADRARLFALVEVTPWLDWLLLTKRPEQMVRLAPVKWAHGWPSNAWAGTTTGTRETLALRVPRLRHVPAGVRFLSVEPMLDNVFQQDCDLSGIHWTIFGFESGGKARPGDVAWIRLGISVSRMWSIAPFVKQLGKLPHDGDRRIVLADRSHGADPLEWDEDLRVREYPQGRAA